MLVVTRLPIFSCGSQEICIKEYLAISKEIFKTKTILSCEKSMIFGFSIITGNNFKNSIKFNECTNIQ